MPSKSANHLSVVGTPLWLQLCNYNFVYHVGLEMDCRCEWYFWLKTLIFCQRNITVWKISYWELWSNISHRISSLHFLWCNVYDVFHTRRFIKYRAMVKNVLTAVMTCNSALSFRKPNIPRLYSLPCTEMKYYFIDRSRNCATHGNSVPSK